MVYIGKEVGYIAAAMVGLFLIFFLYFTIFAPIMGGFSTPNFYIPT